MSDAPSVEALFFAALQQGTAANREGVGRAVIRDKIAGPCSWTRSFSCCVFHGNR